MKKINKSYEKWYIYLIFQVAFIFLTQIYYNVNFITLSSNFITRFPRYFKINLHWLLLEDNFLSHKKMHISEYDCKTCLKKLGILLKCKISYSLSTLLKYWSSTTFFQRFLTTVFKEHQFPSKNQKVPLCWVLWIQKCKSYEISSSHIY